MHSSLRSALYGPENNQHSRQDETISELEEYLKEGQNPNARDGSATSLLELCIDFKSKFFECPCVSVWVSGCCVPVSVCVGVSL